jgi:hypothetical protein
LALRLLLLQPDQSALSLSHRDLVSMIALHSIYDILCLDAAGYIKKLGNFGQKEAHMRDLRAHWRFGRRRLISPTTVAVLKATDIGGVLVRSTHDAKEAIARRPTADHHAFLVAPRHPQLPMLPHRDIAD